MTADERVAELVMQFLTEGVWQRTRLDVDTIDVTSFGGPVTVVPTGWVDIQIRVHVLPKAIPQDLVTQEPA